MRRFLTGLVVVLVMASGSTLCLLAEGPPADRFLETLSAHPVGDEVERDQSAVIYETLTSAAVSEVERVLPAVLQYTRAGNESHARSYAALFLSAVAIRPDGAELLSSKSEEISSLLLDADSGIQRVALVVTDYVIGRPGTNNLPYVTALKSAIENSKTPQDSAVGMITPLLTFGSGDPNAIKSVIEFVHRSDLSVDTRRELVHTLGSSLGLPEEISQALSKELDDPDPAVRVTALVAFADSTTRFHSLSKSRVEAMANDPNENPKVRELAKEAAAGKTGLNPNVLVPNVEMLPEKPAEH